jgi:hypothetical protein
MGEVMGWGRLSLRRAKPHTKRVADGKTYRNLVGGFEVTTTPPLALVVAQ